MISLKNILSGQPHSHKQGKRIQKRTEDFLSKTASVWEREPEISWLKLRFWTQSLPHSFGALPATVYDSGNPCICSERHRHTAPRPKEGRSHILIEIWGSPNWKRIHFSHLTMSCTKPPISCLFCSYKWSKRARIHLRGCSTSDCTYPATNSLFQILKPPSLPQMPSPKGSQGFAHPDPAMHFLEPFFQVCL